MKTGNTYTTLLVCLSFTIAACSTSPNNPQAQPEENHDMDSHWSYQGETGPAHWKEIEKKSDCGGKRQSPVNIVDVNVLEDDGLHPIEFYYSDKVKIHDVTNNGHSILYNFEKGDYITLGEKKYELIQIHFHEPAEHTINGIRFPIEMHLVHLHKGVDRGEVAVVAILGQEGKNNPVFDFLESYLPLEVGETKEIGKSFNLNHSLPDNREFYTYSGSLTTPPCTEGVTWYVFKQPITLSVKQVKQLQQLMPLNNYRSEQPINERKIRRGGG